jgi:hypothetical protein
VWLIDKNCTEIHEGKPFMANVIKSIKKLFTTRRSIFIGLDIPLVILIIVFYLGLSPNKSKIDAPIIVADSVKLSSAMAISHNSALISIITEREATDRQLLTASFDGLRQTRSIYIVILAALSSLAFGGNSKNTVMVIILVVILSMYFLDVHAEDLLTRQKEGMRISTNALIKMTNLCLSDTTRYLLTYEKMDAQFEDAKSGSLLRKLYIAFHPDLERIIFYILPLLLVFCLLQFELYKRSS